METEKMEEMETRPPEQPEKQKKRNMFLKAMSIKRKIVLCGILVLVLAVICLIGSQLLQNSDKKAEVLTVSTLEKIVNVSELNTFTAIHNGIAEVANEKKPEKIDYYVSYQARVKVGVDFSAIKFSIDNENMTVTALMPPVKINEANVDMASLDFMFYNKKANQSSVSQNAYKACVADVEQESAEEDAILELGRENAENVIRALTTPIVKEYDSEYELLIEWEAEQ